MNNNWVLSPEASADDKYCPGTYLSGGYSRLTADVAGQRIENEDLVNLPNWLLLSIKIGDKDVWLHPDRVALLDYRHALDLRNGILSRTFRLRNDKGQVTRWDEKRIVSMDNQHLAALSVTVTPKNWSEPMTLRLGIDGGATNAGVPRYGTLSGQHLETLDRGARVTTNAA